MLFYCQENLSGYCVMGHFCFLYASLLFLMLLLLSQRGLCWKDAEVTRSKEVLNNQPAGVSERSLVRGGEAQGLLWSVRPRCVVRLPAWRPAAPCPRV